MSSLSRIEYSPLHYRSLERDKTNCLRENKINFGASVTLSQSVEEELHCWPMPLHANL